MYIPNDDTQNHPSCRLRLDTQLKKQTIQKSIKVPKVVKQTNKKTLL